LIRHCTFNSVTQITVNRCKTQKILLVFNPPNGMVIPQGADWKQVSRGLGVRSSDSVVFWSSHQECYLSLEMLVIAVWRHCLLF